MVTSEAGLEMARTRHLTASWAELPMQTSLLEICETCWDGWASRSVFEGATTSSGKGAWKKSSICSRREAPELSGCAADGRTYQQALANVEVVIQEWIETAKELGRPIPVPKGRLEFA
jgi:hypothetical protein